MLLVPEMHDSKQAKCKGGEVNHISPSQTPTTESLQHQQQSPYDRDATSFCQAEVWSYVNMHCILTDLIMFDCMGFVCVVVCIRERVCDKTLSAGEHFISLWFYVHTAHGHTNVTQLVFSFNMQFGFSYNMVINDEYHKLVKQLVCNVKAFAQSDPLRISTFTPLSSAELYGELLFVLLLSHYSHSRQTQLAISCWT